MALIVINIWLYLFPPPLSPISVALHLLCCSTCLIALKSRHSHALRTILVFLYMVDIVLVRTRNECEQLIEFG